MENGLPIQSEDLIESLIGWNTKSNAEFIISSPLYKTYKVNETYIEAFQNFLSKDMHFDDPLEIPLTFDTFCPKCKKESTFKNLFTEKGKTTTNFEVGYAEGQRKSYELQLGGDQRIYVKEFVCARDSTHINIYVFLLSAEYKSDLSITKIGEYPSNLVAHSLSLKKYKKYFSNYHDELVRSLKIYSSGIGVGAFVYLRRIFENLVWEAFERHKENNDQIDENDFKKKKMIEKIEYLSDELPDFLVKNKTLYSILSKGIHSLDESSCLQMYNFIKDSILLILDQEIEKLENKNKIDKLGKEINKINSNLGTME